MEYTEKNAQLYDELLDIVKTLRPSEYNGIIAARKEWDILYHLSDYRANVIEWMEDDEDASVLEIGAECGAVTGTLAEKYGSVTCVEVSEKFSEINAVRNAGRGNVQIRTGRYCDMAKEFGSYDIITLIGSFSAAQKHMDTDEPHADLLRSLREHLKPGGSIIMAAENRFGLKYWAGCAEDESGIAYEGIEGYRRPGKNRTFTKKELESLIAGCGCHIEKMYYPYPDYRFAKRIYSDDCLPKAGELADNSNNFDAERVSTFDEAKVFDSVIEDGQFPDFSNSFLAIIKEGAAK